MLSSEVSKPTRAQQSCNPMGVYEATAKCGAKSECRPQRLEADTHSTSCQAAPNLWHLPLWSVTTAPTPHRWLEASCATMEVIESQETIVSVVPIHHAGLGSLSGGCGTHRVREMGPAPAPSAPRPVPVRAGGSPGPAAGAGLAAAQDSAESPAACSGTEAGLEEIPRGSLLLAGGRGVVRHPLGSQKYGMGGMSQLPQQHTPHEHTSQSLTCFCGWLL